MTSDWKHIDFITPEISLDVDKDFQTKTIYPGDIPSLRRAYFKQANDFAKKLKSKGASDYHKDVESIEKLKYFYYESFDN